MSHTRDMANSISISKNDWQKYMLPAFVKRVDSRLSNYIIIY